MSKYRRRAMPLSSYSKKRQATNLHHCKEPPDCLGPDAEFLGEKVHVRGLHAARDGRPLDPETGYSETAAELARTRELAEKLPAPDLDQTRRKLAEFRDTFKTALLGAGRIRLEGIVDAYTLCLAVARDPQEADKVRAHLDDQGIRYKSDTPIAVLIARLYLTLRPTTAQYYADAIRGAAVSGIEPEDLLYSLEIGLYSLNKLADDFRAWCEQQEPLPEKPELTGDTPMHPIGNDPVPEAGEATEGYPTPADNESPPPEVVEASAPASNPAETNRPAAFVITPDIVAEISNIEPVPERVSITFTRHAEGVWRSISHLAMHQTSRFDGEERP